MKRTLTFGVRTRTRTAHLRMLELIDTSRFMWNATLAEHENRYSAYCCGKETAAAFGLEKPQPKFFDLVNKIARPIKNQHEWLDNYNSHVVTESTARKLAGAYTNFLKDETGNVRPPGFKSRYRDGQSFEIPHAVKLNDGVLTIPGCRTRKSFDVDLIGWNGRRYRHNLDNPKTATLKHELGRWICTIVFEVHDNRIDNGNAVGIDLNVADAAIATSSGRVRPFPTDQVNRYTARKKRYQRMVSRRRKGSNRRRRASSKLHKTERKIARVRKDWSHKETTAIVESASTVVVEDLKVKSMTAKATGKGKRQKAGLNREFLNVAPAQIRQMLEYKAITCQSVNPAYTSQTCSGCGHIDATSRDGRRFSCTSCGHTMHADINAAINILMAGGHPATGRREALALATSTNRQYQSVAAA